jgi:hypothetical protein
VSFTEADKADEEQALRLPFSIEQSITTHDFQASDRDCLTLDHLDNLNIGQPRLGAHDVHSPSSAEPIDHFSERHTPFHKTRPLQHNQESVTLFLRRSTLFDLTPLSPPLSTSIRQYPSAAAI